MKKLCQKKRIAEIICLIFGILLSIVGLYYFHMQYLCYEYTPLQFILALVVCLGGSLLSIPLGKECDKKKKVVRAIVIALVFALVLIGGMFLMNGIMGSGELELLAMVIPVYITFIMTTILASICVFKIFSKKAI